MKQRIKVGQHVLDLWKIFEVKAINKGINGKIRVMILTSKGIYEWAEEGDFLCQREDGQWEIEKKEGGQS